MDFVLFIMDQHKKQTKYQYIYPGETQYVDFFDGTRSCLFDFKAVTLAGNQVIRNRVDVCSVSFWSLY